MAAEKIIAKISSSVSQFWKRESQQADNGSLAQTVQHTDNIPPPTAFYPAATDYCQTSSLTHGSNGGFSSLRRLRTCSLNTTCKVARTSTLIWHSRKALTVNMKNFKKPSSNIPPTWNKILVSLSFPLSVHSPPHPQKKIQHNTLSDLYRPH